MSATAYDVDAKASVWVNSAQLVDSAQAYYYLGCQVKNPYARTIVKSSWSAALTASVVASSNGTAGGYTAVVPGGQGSNMQYLLKAMFNVNIPEVVLTNTCPDYVATTGTAGSYDITFPIPSAAALAAIVGVAGGGIGPGIAGASTAIPALTTAGTALFGTPILAAGIGGVAVGTAGSLAVGDLITFRCCYSATAPIMQATFSTTVACSDPCLTKSLYVIQPDICITPIFPVPVAPILSTTGATLYPGVAPQLLPGGQTTAPSPSAGGLVVPATDPLTGIPLRGAGFGSIGAILASLPGGTGVFNPLAVQALCPPVAPGPSCAGLQNGLFGGVAQPGVAPCSPAIFPVANGVVPFTTAAAATPLAQAQLAVPTGAFGSLPIGSQEFLTAAGFYQPVVPGLLGGSIFPTTNTDVSGLISALAAVGAPNSFCACAQTPTATTGACGQRACVDGFPGCLRNVPSTPLGSVFPVVGCVTPVTLQYARQRAYFAPEFLLDYIKSVTISNGCFSEKLTSTSNAAAINYIMKDDSIRQAILQSMGNTDAYANAYYAGVGTDPQTVIPAQSFSINLPFGFSRNKALGFPMFLSKKPTTITVELANNGNLTDYMVIEREVIQPVIVLPSSIGFSPIFVNGQCLQGAPLPANPDGSQVPPPIPGYTPAIAPECLPLQCTPLGIPGTGIRTGRFVQVNNVLTQSPVDYLTDQEGRLTKLDTSFSYATPSYLINLPDQYNGQFFQPMARCSVDPSFVMFYGSITEEQIAKTQPKADEPVEYITEKFKTVASRTVVAGGSVDFDLSNVTGETKALFIRATNLTSKNFGYAGSNGTSNAFNPAAPCAQNIINSISSDSFVSGSGQFFNNGTSQLVDAAIPVQDNVYLVPTSADILSLNPVSTVNYYNVGGQLTAYTSPACSLARDYILTDPISVLCNNNVSYDQVIPIAIRGLSCCTSCPVIYITSKYLGNPYGQNNYTIRPNRAAQANGCAPCQANTGCGSGNEIVLNSCGELLSETFVPDTLYNLELVAWQWNRTQFLVDGTIRCANDRGVDQRCKCRNAVCPVNAVYNNQVTQTANAQALAANTQFQQAQPSSPLQSAAALPTQQTRASLSPSANAALPPRQQYARPVTTAAGCRSCAGN